MIRAWRPCGTGLASCIQSRQPVARALQRWNGNLRTDVSAAVTSLDFIYHLLVWVSVNALHVFAHFLEETLSSAGKPHDHDMEWVAGAVGDDLGLLRQLHGAGRAEAVPDFARTDAEPDGGFVMPRPAPNPTSTE